MSFGLTRAVPSPVHPPPVSSSHTPNVNNYTKNKQTKLQKQRGAPCSLPPPPSLP